MPRPPRPRWHDGNRRFCSNVGPPKVAGGKATAVYFPKDIGRDERPQIDGVPCRAWDWLAAYQRAAMAGVSDSDGPTAYVLCQMYLNWAEVESQAGRLTHHQYQNKCTHLSRFWEFGPTGGTPYGDRAAGSLTASDLELFAQAMAGRYSEHYIRNLCRSVHACWNWAASPCPGRAGRLVPANEMRGYTPPKPAKVERYMAPAPMRGFLRWAWTRAKALPPRRVGKREVERAQRRSDLNYVRMLWFLVLTGARPGEACNLRWKDVRWDEGIAILSEWKNKKSTRVDREIHLPPTVERLLRRIHRLEGRHPEFVFTHRLGRGQGGTSTSTEGAPWDTGGVGYKLRKWRAAAVKSGVPVVTDGANRLVAYIARHSYISDGLMAGVTPDDLGQLCGTSSEMIRETYGHIQRSHSARKARELAERRREDGKRG